MEKLTANNITSVMEKIFSGFKDHYQGQAQFTEDPSHDLILFKFRIGSGIYPKNKICTEKHINTLIHSVQLDTDLINDRLFLALQDGFNTLQFDGVDLETYSQRIVLSIAIAMGGYIYYLCTISSSGKLVFKERVNDRMISIDKLSMRGSNSKEARDAGKQPEFHLIEYLRLS